MSSLFKNDLKRVRDIMILAIGIYGILLLLTILVYEKESLIILFYTISVLFTVIVGAKNFEYLHNRTKATHMLSLPYTKSQIVIVKYLSGLVALAIPTGIYIIMYYLLLDVILPIVPVVLMITIYYGLACVAAVITGNLKTYIFLYGFVVFVPTILYICMSAFFVAQIPSLVDLNISMSVLRILFPVFGIVGSSLIEAITVQNTELYIVYSVVIAIVVYILGKYRPLETTNKGFAFPVLDVILNVIVVLTGSWILTAVLEIADSTSISVLAFKQGIVTIVLAGASQLIRMKKLKYVSLITQTVGIVMATTCIYIISADRIEKYIPSDIEMAQIVNRSGYSSNYNVTYHPISGSLGYLETEEDIAAVKEIHKQFLELPTYNDSNFPFYFWYKLEDGDTLMRQYFIDEKDWETVKDTKAVQHFYRNAYQKFMNRMEKQQEIRIMEYSGEGDFDQSTAISITGENVNTFKRLLAIELEKEIDVFPYSTEEIYIIFPDVGHPNGGEYYVDSQGPVLRAYQNLKKIIN